MPIYEYECKKCHHRFERIQGFSAPPVKTCPKCKGPVEQLIHAPAVQFKGSGWYVTDYARKSSAPASDGGAKSEEKSAKSEDKSSDRKESKGKSDTKKSKD